jgi:hypothetical protein
MNYGVQVITIEEAADKIDEMFDELAFKKVRKVVQGSVYEAGRFFIKTAKYAVPKKDRYTQKSIQGRKIGKTYVVMSDVRQAPGNTKSFPYNTWLDRRRTSRGKWYGTGAQQLSGVAVSGKRPGGFWTFATEQTQKHFKDTIIRDISK